VDDLFELFCVGESVVDALFGRFEDYLLVDGFGGVGDGVIDGRSRFRGTEKECADGYRRACEELTARGPVG
jgi:hypothetical protein